MQKNQENKIGIDMNLSNCLHHKNNKIKLVHYYQNTWLQIKIKVRIALLTGLKQEFYKLNNLGNKI
jgi:hypothetical protein